LKIGPLLLGRDFKSQVIAQGGVLDLVFKVADDQGWLLLLT
jgi:hypothetical protein